MGHFQTGGHLLTTPRKHGRFGVGEDSLEARMGSAPVIDRWRARRNRRRAEADARALEAWAREGFTAGQERDGGTDEYYE